MSILNMLEKKGQSVEPRAILKKLLNEGKTLSEEKLNFIKDQTKNLIFFLTLKSKRTEIDFHAMLCFSMKMYTCAEGEELSSKSWFEEGSAGGIYILFRGKIILENPFQELPIGTLLYPSSLNLNKFMIQGISNDKKLKLLSETDILYIPKSTWQLALKRESDAKKLKQSQILQQLFFSEMSSRILSYKMQESSKKIRILRNQIIIKEGEKSEAIYVILRGEIGIYKNFKAKKEKSKIDHRLDEMNIIKAIFSVQSKKALVFKLDSHHFFGPQSIDQVTENRYTASCISYDAKLLKIEFKDFLRILSEDVNSKQKFRKILENKFAFYAQTESNIRRHLFPKKKVNKTEASCEYEAEKEESFVPNVNQGTSAIFSLPTIDPKNELKKKNNNMRASLPEIVEKKKMFQGLDDGSPNSPSTSRLKVMQLVLNDGVVFRGKMVNNEEDIERKMGPLSMDNIVKSNILQSEKKNKGKETPPTLKKDPFEWSKSNSNMVNLERKLLNNQFTLKLKPSTNANNSQNILTDSINMSLDHVSNVQNLKKSNTNIHMNNQRLLEILRKLPSTEDPKISDQNSLDHSKSRSLALILSPKSFEYSSLNDSHIINNPKKTDRSYLSINQSREKKLPILSPSPMLHHKEEHLVNFPSEKSHINLDGENGHKGHSQSPSKFLNFVKSNAKRFGRVGEFYLKQNYELRSDYQNK